MRFDDTEAQGINPACTSCGRVHLGFCDPQEAGTARSTGDLTLDEIVALFQRVIADVGASLEPDEDLTPALFLAETAEGSNAIAAVPQLGDERFKPIMLGAVIPSIIAQQKPKWAALLTMGWAKLYENTSTLESAAEQARDAVNYGSNVGQMPDRKEVVMLFLRGRDGQERLCMAEVTRVAGRAPELSWRDDGPGESEGGVVEALRRGFAQAQA